jgi:hypothetical protein
MSINSLSELVSGDIVNPSSYQMFLATDSGPFRFSIPDFGFFSANSLELGAQWQCNTTQAWASLAYRDYSAMCGSLAYDTGSWTRADSLGRFYISDATYTHVDIFCEAEVSGYASFGNVGLYKNGSAVSPVYRLDGVQSGAIGYHNHAWLDFPVSSGEIYDLRLYNSATFQINAHSIFSKITIRGTRRNA